MIKDSTLINVQEEPNGEEKALLHPWFEEYTQRDFLFDVKNNEQGQRVFACFNVSTCPEEFLNPFPDQHVYLTR